MLVEIDESHSVPGRVEFTVDVAPPPAFPADVNFLIGNIVTDARSCLDMAVEAIWHRYELQRKGVVVQFPLEGNFARKRAEDSRLQRFLERLDPRFVEVIEDAQPDYVDGMFDIPANLSALFINHLSNANKHRNITPAVLRVGLAMWGTNAAGLELSLMSDREHGAPPARFALVYDVEQHSDQEARSYVASLKRTNRGPVSVSFVQQAIVDRQAIPLEPPRFQGERLEWSAQLDDLFTKVPQYIRFTLRNLNRVHQVIQTGGEEFYLLDAHGGL